MKRVESAGRGERKIGWLLGSDEADLWLREERVGGRRRRDWKSDRPARERSCGFGPACWGESVGGQERQGRRWREPVKAGDGAVGVGCEKEKKNGQEGDGGIGV